ncbi:CAP domain [Trinorchestia longiramus]|nr:CAP domain [Trinorchestia longiramus]
MRPDTRPRDTPPSAGQVDPSHIQVRRHLVRLHNLLRSKVRPSASNMLAMSWHGAAASQARRWAGSCVTHRGRDDPNARWTPRYGACGQNVLVTRRKKRWGQVIRTWWGERRFFEYGASNALNGTYRARSYTQLVWYSSHRVGCGYAECTTSGGVKYHRYVCNYCPAGNDPSSLSEPYATGRPCEMCPRACRYVSLHSLQVCEPAQPAGRCVQKATVVCVQTGVLSRTCGRTAAPWRAGGVSGCVTPRLHTVLNASRTVVPRASVLWPGTKLSELCLCSCGAHVHVFSCGAHVHVFSCGAHLHVFSCGAHVHVFSCGAHVRVFSCGAHVRVFSCGAHVRVFSCGAHVHV